MKIPFLESGEVQLIKLDIEDISTDYLNGINNQDFDKFTTHAIHPKNKKDLEDYLVLKQKNKDIWLGIFNSTTKKHIGNIEIYNIDHVTKSAKYAIILWADAGKGYAKQASNLIIDHAFRNVGLNRIELGVHTENAAAIKLYKSLGFVQEGILRDAGRKGEAFFDVMVMSVLSRDYLK